MTEFGTLMTAAGLLFTAASIYSHIHTKIINAKIDETPESITNRGGRRVSFSDSGLRNVSDGRTPQVFQVAVIGEQIPVDRPTGSSTGPIRQSRTGG